MDTIRTLLPKVADVTRHIVLTVVQVTDNGLIPVVPHSSYTAEAAHEGP